jgi:PAS domain S-box-containing protein
MGESTPAKPTLDLQIFRDVFNACPIGIAVEDFDGRPLFTNPAFCSFLGFSEEELRNKHCVDFSPPEDAQKDWALFQQLKAGSIDHYQLEKRYFRADNSLVWGSLSISLLNSRPSDVLKRALESHHGLPAVTEIIGNYAAFDYPTIAEAVIKYFYDFGGVVQYQCDQQPLAFRYSGRRITGRLSSDFIRLANAEFLDALVRHCCERGTEVSNLLVAYAVTELYGRMLKLKEATYKKAVAVYKTVVLVVVHLIPRKLCLVVSVFVVTRFAASAFAVAAAACFLHCSALLAHTIS